MPAVNTAGPVSSPQRTYESSAPILRGVIVTQGAADNLVAQAGANAVPVGVVEESIPSAGLPLSVTRRGDAVVVIGAPVNAGQWVISDANGHAVPSAATGDNLVGKAITSGTTAGDEILIDVIPGIR